MQEQKGKIILLCCLVSSNAVDIETAQIETWRMSTVISSRILDLISNTMISIVMILKVNLVFFLLDFVCHFYIRLKNYLYGDYVRFWVGCS